MKKIQKNLWSIEFLKRRLLYINKLKIYHLCKKY
jgi:hypothetical protein